MKKLKKVLISLVVVAIIMGGAVLKADIIDDCIKCPGLQTIFDIYYTWTYVA